MTTLLSFYEVLLLAGLVPAFCGAGAHGLWRIGRIEPLTALH